MKAFITADIEGITGANA